MDLQLIGMYCAACATKIEKVVSKMPGVNQANVNFALETARVEFNPAEVSLSDIQQRVEKLGYQAVSKQETLDQEGHRKEAITKQKRKLLLSAILSLPLLWAMVSHFSFTSWIWMPDLFMNPWFQLILATPVQFLSENSSMWEPIRLSATKAPIWTFWSHSVPQQPISTVCI